MAGECGVYFCAKAYTATVLNGALKESEVSTWAVREARSWRAADHEHADTRPGSDYDPFDLQEVNFSPSQAGSTFRTDLQLLIPEKELLDKNANLPKELQMGQDGISPQTLSV